MRQASLFQIHYDLHLSQLTNKAKLAYATEDARTLSGFVPSMRFRNFTHCGTMEGGASSLVASTIAWSSPLFIRRPENNFRLSLSRTSALSITTNRNPVTIARAIWKATLNRNRSDSESCFSEKPRRSSLDEPTRSSNGSSTMLEEYLKAARCRFKSSVNEPIRPLD